VPQTSDDSLFAAGTVTVNHARMHASIISIHAGTGKKSGKNGLGGKIARNERKQSSKNVL